MATWYITTLYFVLAIGVLVLRQYEMGNITVRVKGFTEDCYFKILLLFLVFYLIFLSIRDITAGDDLPAYYAMLDHFSRLNELDIYDGVKKEIGFFIVVRALSSISTAPVMMDMLVGGGYLFFVSELRRRGASWESLAVLSFVLLGGRLFIEYSSNIIRSLLASYFIVLSYFSLKDLRRWTSFILLCFALSFHIKIAIIYIFLLFASLPISYGLNLYLLAISFGLMMIKVTAPQMFSFLTVINPIIEAVSGDAKNFLRVGSIEDKRGLSFSLFVQFFVYVFLPALVVSVYGSVKDKENVKVVCVSIMFYAILYPQISISERFLVFPLLLVSVLLSTISSFSEKKALGRMFYGNEILLVFIFIMNLVSLFLFSKDSFIFIG